MVTPTSIKIALKDLRAAVEAGHIKPQTYDTLFKLLMEYGPIEYRGHEEPSLQETLVSAWAAWSEAQGVQLELPLIVQQLDE